jgi:CRISPR-associated endonuclease/helicase Cas3
VEVLPSPVEDAAIAARFAEALRMLCIVNSRAHARALFGAVRGMEGAAHLSTLMCPVHRRAVLATLRERLRRGDPVRLVATSLIEAGVDIDFPEVWRAAAGLDAIAQAAGRCNRNGLLREGGRVVVFTPAEHAPPQALREFWQAARPVLPRHEDLLGLDAVRDYFRELYYQKGPEALDSAVVEDQPGILAALSRTRRELRFPFASIAQTFRVIEDAMVPIVVPLDATATELLARLRTAERPSAALLRQAQQYTVGVPRRARDAWLAAGALAPLHPGMPEGPLAFADAAHYRPETGLDIEALSLRDAANNIL